MIIRDYANCTSCGNEYIIRFNVGNKLPQTSTFSCEKCGELLTYGYDKDRNKILYNLIRVKENEHGAVINLHSELPINSKLKNDPTYFPSIDFLVKVDHFNKGDIDAFRNAQQSCMNYVSGWDEISTDFRYLKEDRLQLLEDKYGKDNKNTISRITTKVIIVSHSFIEGKWIGIYNVVLAEAEKAKKHPKFDDLKNHLLTLKDEILIKKMYTIMEQYRQVEPVLLSTLLSQKCGIKPEGLSSSVNWNNIEMTYGNIYEIYGDLLVIPTIINNLITRGDYEKFATTGFTLEKYNDTDKAGRCQNFLSNACLMPLQDFYDASLRNGTHHKASEFNKDSQEIILKTGKGGKAQRFLTMVEYIAFCNELYARCLILFHITYTLLS